MKKIPLEMRTYLCYYTITREEIFIGRGANYHTEVKRKEERT